MNKRESNKLSSFDAVITVLDDNPDLIASIPVVGETVTNFKSVVSEIKNGNLEFIGRTKGVTENKSIIEDKLASAIFKIAGILYVYAVKTKNTDLASKVKTSRTELVSLRDPMLINKSSQILILANELLPSLTGYGITAETLTAAQTAIDEFQSAIGEQSKEHTGMVTDRETIKGKFYEATRILENELDPLIELFEDTAPDFYYKYHNARMIADRGLRHNSTEESEKGEEGAG